jgi:TRAP-type C4-dicarboxylate transport system substrate-binding protein
MQFKPLLAATVLAISAGSALAQEVTLKVHHFLSPNATSQKLFLGPWCEKIAKESNNRLKCQIYPAMQLGGTPPQLFDQAKDGVADIVWTVPTYQAGRFVKSEVFELPFMTKTAEGSSRAFWEYLQRYSLDEFKGTRRSSWPMFMTAPSCISPASRSRPWRTSRDSRYVPRPASARA